MRCNSLTLSHTRTDVLQPGLLEFQMGNTSDHPHRPLHIATTGQSGQDSAAIEACHRQTGLIVGDESAREGDVWNEDNAGVDTRH